MDPKQRAELLQSKIEGYLASGNPLEAANILSNLGRPSEAEPLYREAFRMGIDNCDPGSLLGIYYKLENSLADQGKPFDLEPQFKQLLKRLAGMCNPIVDEALLENMTQIRVLTMEGCQIQGSTAYEALLGQCSGLLDRGEAPVENMEALNERHAQQVLNSGEFEGDEISPSQRYSFSLSQWPLQVVDFLLESIPLNHPVVMSLLEMQDRISYHLIQRAEIDFQHELHITLLRRLANAREQTRGQDDPETVQTLSRLVDALRDYGENSRAEALYARIHSLASEVNDPDHTA